MEIRQYILLLWRWAWLLVLGTVTAGGIAYYVSQNQTPIYQSTSILLVSEGGTRNDEYAFILTSERLALSYVERLTNHDVLSRAIDNLGLEISAANLANRVEVDLVSGTHLVGLSVEDPDPQIASDLANEIPKVFAERNMTQQLERFNALKDSLDEELIQLEVELVAAEVALETEIKKTVPDQIAIDQANAAVLRLRETQSRLLQNYQDIQVAEVSSLNNIIIDEFARPARSPIRPRVMNNTIVAATAGLLMAVGIGFLIEYLDDTVRNPQDIEKETGLISLGNIRLMKKSGNPIDALVVAMEPRSPAAEAYRQIRTNIQYAGVDRKLKTLLVTSANIGEGKSTIAANLAAALAQSGKRVILVDTDMRRPTLHRLLEVDGSKGLSNLIIRGNQDPQFIKGTLISNLRLLPSGRLPPNPAELLGSERMKEVIRWLEEQADYVIFDSPPLLAVTDAAVLSRLVDSSIIVVSTTETRFPIFTTAVKQILALDSHVAGVILNKVNYKRNNGYYYYYYYNQTSYEPTSTTTYTNGHYGSNGFVKDEEGRSKGLTFPKIF